MTTALEDLAVIGVGETVALVGRHGAIEWLCLPRFDSPACCAALLGTKEHGHRTIAPKGKITKAEHRYRSDTLVVMETDPTCAGGPLPVTHGAPIRDRVQARVGFILVKRIQAIEFDEDYRDIGMGQGGWREDQQCWANAVGI